MRWHSPLPLMLVESGDSLSFKTMPAHATALPLPPHPGAFGAQRRHHTHEGVDMYCASGTPVAAVEDGIVVAVIAFTGPKAGSDWWHDTDAVLVEGASGVVLYGEITAAAGIALGAEVKRGARIGNVVTVLKEDKGRPLSMLHLELHAAGTREAYEWTEKTGRPESLRDPTPFLKEAAA